MTIRQVTSLKNGVEQDHRAVQRISRPMVGCKAFDAAQDTLTGIELMPMVRQGQWAGAADQRLTAAEPFYALAASSPSRQGRLHVF
jgi:transposase-like protein